MDRLSLARPSFATADGALSREWLLTNGMGGFASGTVAQANTRRYHGLLVATLKPPLDRVLMVSKADASVSYRGSRYELACNEFADGTLAPRGFEYLSGFHLDGTTPVWTFAIGDALLEQRVWMVRAENTTHVQYRLVHAGAPLSLEIVPLCTYRDYHAQARGRQDYAIESRAAGCTLTAFPGARPYRLDLDRGQFRRETEYYWNFRHRIEAERGLDADEDLLRPGVFTAELQPGETLTFTVSAEPEPARPQLERELERQQSLLFALPPSAPLWVRRLTLAADQFIVARDGAAAAGRSADTRRGATIIAGYPWFGDWGRDTMIALPGLAVATGRHNEAASILRTFAQHLSQGMLPNRFPDDGEAPEYNTVDATLWYFHAIAEYQAASNDLALVRELYPSLREIIEWHQRGTRYGIHVDPVDGLLRAGEPGVQLTWMDAKVGDWVVTPRTGKAGRDQCAVAQRAAADESLGHRPGRSRWRRAGSWRPRRRLPSPFRGASGASRPATSTTSSIAPRACMGTASVQTQASVPTRSSPCRWAPTCCLRISSARWLIPARACCSRPWACARWRRMIRPMCRTIRAGRCSATAATTRARSGAGCSGPSRIAHHQVYGDAAHAQALLANSRAAPG